ncbi:putative vesicle tethering protein [Phytophthora sojae]|uniref:Vesicle tethering protein n=1 Tax=Phytophthora sojae (strain P6497) TaxID=1094619 RepID=G5ADF6_PHYSP|nr:putative vesicle tethering protein [Phytophthora sojae]EGZ06209.1 putative vesicle tethering protein [Phytophthora sojae]|eukprot:XP_009538106.1 putative vesicle tethering protein [Phytophthora sojae]
MEVEGLAETGASPASSVIADCLQIVNNMVRDNLMTQTLFLEMPYLESHVPRLLRLPGIDGGEEEEDAAALSRRKRVLKLGLQLVRFLVAGLYEGARESSLDEMAQRDRDRKGQELARIQSLVARQEALMGAVGELVCCRSDALADLRLQALDLLRLVTEHNGGAQMILVNLYASPSGRNVLAELVNLDVGNESDESPIAAASSALLDSLFEENEGARMAVLQHIQSAPPPPMSTGGDGGYDAFSAPPSAGRVLLDAFICNTEFIVQCNDSGVTQPLNNELVVAWKASHRLAGLLSNSSYCKELALRVPAEYDHSDARAVAGGLFLSRCLRLLRSSVEDELSAALQSIVFQAKLSVFLLLIRWCHGCPKAVREIVGSVTNLSVLVDSLSDGQPISSSSRGASEVTQLRGLVALLLGCCLEFLCEDEEEQALKIANTALKPVGVEEDQGLQMTRDQLLELISKRVGLERFTDALVKFQQTPALIACARTSKTQSSRTLLAYRATYDISEENAEGSSEDAEAHYLFMLYERSFTAFYREMAEQIQKRVIAIYTGVDRGSSPSSGVEPGAPSAIGAYQDLIRMQDKQIHDLQQEVENLKQRVAHGAGDPNATNASTTDPRSEDELLEKLSTQREQFEREKAELESKIKSMSESALEMETRVNGLTMAYEQLEREHQQRGQELAAAHAGMTEVSSLAASSGLEEQIAALQAELDAERETNRRLRTEATAAKGGAASQALREKGDAELANARLMNQLEELRVENKQKDEQLAECTQMLETLTEGQNLVKRDNERLKAELTELRSRTDQAGEADRTEFKSVVDGLMDDKVRLEHRVEELEAAARAAYEKDQEVLRQRIQEVEAARRASPPVSVECAALETALPAEEALKTEAAVGGESEEANEDQRLKELVSTQLEELKELRALVAEMETVAIERDAQGKQASFLQELVAGYDVQSRRDKEKFEATVRELEDELARAFLEKKDAGRKAKAAVKELENEVARLFLAKVELEKELSVHQQDERGSHAENGEMLSANGSFRRSIESETSNDSTLDDLLVLVASLEIQCSVLRESLKEAQGEDAVAVAIELSRQRGAVVSV